MPMLVKNISAVVMASALGNGGFEMNVVSARVMGSCLTSKDDSIDGNIDKQVNNFTEQEMKILREKFQEKIMKDYQVQIQEEIRKKKFSEYQKEIRKNFFKRGHALPKIMENVKGELQNSQVWAENHMRNQVNKGIPQRGIRRGNKQIRRGNVKKVNAQIVLHRGDAERVEKQAHIQERRNQNQRAHRRMVAHNNRLRQQYGCSQQYLNQQTRSNQVGLQQRQKIFSPIREKRKIFSQYGGLLPPAMRG